MTAAERHARVKRIFTDAAELPQGERTRFLERQCDGDLFLRGAVEALLRADGQTAAGALRQPLCRPDLHPTSAPGTPPTADEAFPEYIGKYRLLRKIGEGGMGVVFEAQQENPRRTVALKVIRPGFASIQVLRRFDHEAQFLGQLQHPGIAQIYEAGAESVVWPDRQSAGASRCSYFAMEFVSGRMLTEYAESSRLSTSDRLELLARICEAVQFAHGKGVIHRDLKPANILVDALGQPKILDFGVARAINAEGQATTLRTDVGQLIGTLPYMSPEQIAGDPAQIDARSDVYELGVILYELLAGRTPHDLRTHSIAEAVRIIREEEPTRLSSLDRTLRGDVETIVAKALEKEKQRRYSSAADLAADIRRFLRDEPIHARPVSALYQLRKFSRRNRGLVGGMVATFLVLVIGTVVATALAIRAATREALAQRQTYRASLAAATAALRNQDVRAAGESLRLAPPELRCWEWRHLNSLAEGGVAVIADDCGSFSTLAASRDGRVIAALETGGAIQIWDVQRRERRRTIEPGSTPRTARLALSRDGSLLARVTPDGQLDVSDVATGMALWSAAAIAQSLCFSPDGRLLATIVGDWQSAALLDARSGAEVRRIELRRTQRATGIDFSPTGDRLQIADDGANRDFYDVTTGARVATINSWLCTLNQDWSRVIRFGAGHAVLETFPARQLLAQAPATMDALHTAFLPDDMGVVVHSASGSAHVLNNSLHEVMSYPTPADVVGFQDLERADWILAATHSGSLIGLDLLKSRLPFQVPHPSRFPTLCAALSPDGRQSAVAGWGDVRMYDATTGELRWCVWPSREWITSVAFSPDGRRIVVGGGRGAGWVLGAEKGEILTRFMTGPESLLSICWLDDRRIAAGSGAGVITIVDYLTPDEQRTVSAHASPIHTLLLSADGASLASGAGDEVELASLPKSSSGANDCTVRLWNTGDWTCRATLPGTRSAVTAVAQSADGSSLAAACVDGAVIVWRLPSGEVLASLRGVGLCRAIAFHPSEPRLLAWSLDGALRIWDTSRFDDVVMLHTAVGGVCAAGFTPDGMALISAGRIAPIAALESGGRPEGARKRFLQLMAAAELKSCERLLAVDAVAKMEADPLLAGPIREAALLELSRRGDHLNWLISDAITLIRDPNAGNEDLAEAARKVDHAIALKNDEPGPWTVLGELQWRRSKFAEAVEALRRALVCYEQHHQPPSVRTLAWLARSYHATGNADAAQAALQQARSEFDRRRSADFGEQELIAETAKQLGKQ